MAEFPALPLWTDALVADCHHLTDEEFGTYMRLLVLMWRSPNCRVPNDDEWLSRRLRGDFRAIISEFCQTDGNWIWQKRLKQEYRWVGGVRESRSAAAKIRWEKEKRRCKRNAPTPTPTPTKETSEAKASESKKVSKQATFLPDDWLPSETDVAYAREQGLTDEQIQRSAQDFADYWHSVETSKGRKRDWAATWRSWVRKAADGWGRVNGGRPAARQERRGPVGIAETVAWLDARDPDA